jgi:hypothetical protein
MSKSDPQSLKNHGRLDPLYHFVLSIVLLASLIVTIVHLVRHPCFYSAWFVVLSLAAIVAWIRLRTYPLKVQDRVIRLEERLRLQAVLPASQRNQIPALTEPQLIALRFASDSELPALVDAAVTKKLGPKEIKQSIKSWRPDYFRV